MYPGTSGTTVPLLEASPEDARATCPCRQPETAGALWESSQPASPAPVSKPWIFFSTLIRTRPCRDRPKAADPSHPVQNFPPALPSSLPSTPSAPAFACLDRLPFDVNRIGTRLFLMTLSFLSF